MINNTGIVVASLCELVDKYHPGSHPFYIKSLTPFSVYDNVGNTNVQASNIKNKDTNKISTSKVVTGSVFYLDLPKYISKAYPKKFIPKGTEFLVSFIGGDITKGKIIGGIF